MFQNFLEYQETFVPQFSHSGYSPPQLLMHLAVDLSQEPHKSWAADMYWIPHMICTEVPQGGEMM